MLALELLAISILVGLGTWALSTALTEGEIFHSLRTVGKFANIADKLTYWAFTPLRALECHFCTSFWSSMVLSIIGLYHVDGASYITFPLVWLGAVAVSTMVEKFMMSSDSSLIDKRIESMVIEDAEDAASPPAPFVANI